MQKFNFLVTVFVVFLLVPLASCKREHGHHGAHWSYSGKTGPANWGDLKPEYITCKTGKSQSPINIEIKQLKIKQTKNKLTINYKPAQVTVVNNGHSIQVNYSGDSTIEYAGKKYTLLQLHFHSPSEEQVNGKNADMVAHLVHKSADNSLAVIAVLFNKGKENALINKIWKHMPDKAGSKSSIDKAINATDLLPVKRAFWNFTGSLTTPPCTEGVTWFVMQNQVTVSDAQLQKYTALYPGSNRPVQPLHGREVVFGK